jgi:hypothetical protein
LREAGQTVTVLEAAPVAGGRCRSYFDRELGLRIDNGNHLLLSGNRSAFAYLDTIGARSSMEMPAEPLFPFVDLATGCVGAPAEPRPYPWWVLSRHAGAGQPGYRSSGLPARPHKRDATVAASLRNDMFYHRLIEPLAVGAETPPDIALAKLLTR